MCVCVCGGGYGLISLFHRAFNDTGIHVNTIYMLLSDKVLILS